MKPMKPEKPLADVMEEAFKTNSKEAEDNVNDGESEKENDGQEEEPKIQQPEGYTVCVCFRVLLHRLISPPPDVGCIPAAPMRALRACKQDMQGRLGRPLRVLQNSTPEMLKLHWTRPQQANW